MKFDIVRAWKDETYRESLSEAERSQLPVHPAGELSLSDAELESIYGGWTQQPPRGNGNGQNGEGNVNGSGICDINLLQSNILNIDLLGNLLANCIN